MGARDLRALLAGVRSRRVSVGGALERLRDLPFEELGYAKVDHHRALRQGFPEVVMAEGKSLPQLLGICRAILVRGDPLLVTRLSEPMAGPLSELAKDGSYHREARIFARGRLKLRRGARVAVLCAGTSDVAVAEEAAVTAEALGCTVERHYDVGVAGLHRLLARRAALTRARAIVVVAGLEGALASVVGGLSPRPVIAVPTSVGYGMHLAGVATLLGMLNSCAPNVSVVNVDNGFGAGFSAALIARREG
jgi:NCAIR mutase (PurE)-related protein